MWLGLARGPQPQEVQIDPYESKIGGVVALLRLPHSPLFGDDNVAACHACGSPLQLIAQIYAPLGTHDRVLYVFYCANCSKGTEAAPKKAAVTVFRSQRSAPIVEEAAPAVQPLFCEDDDWGDDAGPQPPRSIAPQSKPTPKPVPTPEPLFPGNEQLRSSFQAMHPATALELVLEPPKLWLDGATTERLLSDVESKTPGVLRPDAESEEKDEETVAEKVVRKYIERISRCPTQCIRWDPDGDPLLCRADELPPSAIPRCPHCGSERRFEFQVTSPAVYYLTRHVGERQSPLHFGTVLVYTCRNDCSAHQGYAEEWAFVQSEV